MECANHYKVTVKNHIIVSSTFNPTTWQCQGASFFLKVINEQFVKSLLYWTLESWIKANRKPRLSTLPFTYDKQRRILTSWMTFCNELCCKNQTWHNKCKNVRDWTKIKRHFYALSNCAVFANVYILINQSDAWKHQKHFS